MPESLGVLVLEDEWPARNYLVQLIERSKLAHVVAAVSSTALASEALAASPTAVDVAFVDIHLAGERHPARAGLTWIASLHERSPAAGRDAAPPRVVLTTASSEHAMRAFELGVVDYLLKPFTERRVRASLERIVACSGVPTRSRDVDEVRIAARHGRAIVFLAVADAFAFEAEGRLCYVHTSQGRLDVDLSLNSLEAMLGPSYLRVHRNWLVSTASVRSMERVDGEAVVLVGPNEPPLRVHVARDRAASVRERLLTNAIGLRQDG